MSRAVNFGTARKYLQALAPNADCFTFQTFSDNTKLKQRVPSTGKLVDPHARIISGSFDGAAKLLAQKNALGVGVFVTINETAGNGRSLANFSKARCLWADMDGVAAPEWPIAPSVIVESSPGRFHFYWTLHDDMPLAAWRGCMQRLVESYEADRAAIDPVRVLRLPGFYHCKSKPVLVKLVKCTGRRYTSAELQSAFPPIVRSTAKRRAGLANDDTTDIRALRSALCHLARTPHPKAQSGHTYADDYDTWAQFGMAIKRSIGDAGFAIWDEWAKSSARYPGQEASRAKWDSFDPETRSGTDAMRVGSIFHAAQRHGWSFVKYQVAEALERGRHARSQNAALKRGLREGSSHL